MTSPSLLLHTRGLEYGGLCSLRQVVTEGGRQTISYIGGPGATYLIKKGEKKEGNLLGKWVCGNSADY